MSYRQEIVRRYFLLAHPVLVRIAITCGTKFILFIYFTDSSAKLSNSCNKGYTTRWRKSKANRHLQLSR